MALYLVQHGHSLSKEVDPDRSLSDQGLEEVHFIAAIARDRDINVSRIVHSGKRRANQTAHIFAEEFLPPNGIARMEGLGPNDDVTAVADALEGSQDLMLVSHLPFLDKLVSYLITGSTDYQIVRFQKGGIVCLDRDEEDGAWFVKWTLFPLMA